MCEPTVEYDIDPGAILVGEGEVVGSRVLVVLGVLVLVLLGVWVPVALGVAVLVVLGVLVFVALMDRVVDEEEEEVLVSDGNTDDATGRAVLVMLNVPVALTDIVIDEAEVVLFTDVCVDADETLERVLAVGVASVEAEGETD